MKTKLRALRRQNFTQTFGTIYTGYCPNCKQEQKRCAIFYSTSTNKPIIKYWPYDHQEPLCLQCGLNRKYKFVDLNANFIFPTPFELIVIKRSYPEPCPCPFCKDNLVLCHDVAHRTVTDYQHYYNFLNAKNVFTTTKCIYEFSKMISTTKHLPVLENQSY